MKHKFLALLPALPLLALAGCSSSSGADVEVIFWHTFGQTTQEALQKSGEDFEELIQKELGVNVKLTFSCKGAYDDIKSNIEQGFSAGDVPTMAVAYPDHVANYLGEDNSSRYVYNIENFMNDDEIGFGKQSFLGDNATYDYDDFVPAFIEEGTEYVVEGTYSLPLMKSTEVMFYNVEAVQSAMAIYPAAESYGDPALFLKSLDWDGFMDFATFCYENKDKVLTTMKNAIWYDSDANLFVSKMYQEGIGYSSIVDGKAVIDFESGESRTKAEAMVTKLKEAYDKGVFITKGSGENKYGSDAFTTGKCIFEIGSSGGTGYNDPSGGSFTPGVTMVPASNDNPLYVTQGPTLTFLRNPSQSEEVNSERVKYAWMFAKYLTNPDINTYMCVYGSQGYIPVRYSAYETAEFQSFLSDTSDIISNSSRVVINDIAGHYLNSPVFIGSAELREQCGGIITQVLMGTKEVTKAFDDAIAAAKTSF